MNAKDKKLVGSVRVGGLQLLFVAGVALASFGCGFFLPAFVAKVKTRIPRHDDFPRPLLHKNKKQPKTIYTNECFGGSGSDNVSQNRIDKHLVTEPRVLVHPNVTNDNVDDDDEIDEEDDDDEEEEEEPDGPYQPTGQHLLINIRRVDPTFLLDNERLVDAMIQVVAQAKLTLLSYHCHDFIDPMGVSCAGVLLESHVSFHTFPFAGAITLDLFTCGSESLLPLVPVLKQLFGVPAEDGNQEPFMEWNHKKRGYGDYFDDSGNIVPFNNTAPKNWDSMDVQLLLGLPQHLHKKSLFQGSTEFQTVEIHESAHELALEGCDNEENHNKRVFLDGVLQSTKHGLEPYHEALVHPAMISHPLPERVAIIGGGEGATLREVLKHNTVETCVMVEIDGEFVGMARESLPEWNDCSDFVITDAVSESCFDDPRAELHFEDAIAWFTERFGTEVEDIADEDKFDVIIMDALDPSSAVAFSDILYGDSAFIAALTRALGDEGILVVQTGETDSFYDLQNPGPETGTLDLHRKFFDLLRANGAISTKSYSEGHGQFQAPWDYDIIFMGWYSRENFHMDPAIVDLKLSHQAIATKSGKSPFHYFDGAAMATYQYPSRTQEISFCMDKPVQSKLCGRHRAFDPAVPNVPRSSLEVKYSSIKGAGRGVFFKEGFLRGSYLAIEDAVHSMKVMPSTLEVIENMENYDGFDTLNAYVFGYGFESEFYGGVSVQVDPGVLTFANHGCNSTNNIGVETEDEHSADPHKMPLVLLEDPIEGAFLDIFADRNHFVYLTTTTLNEDVQAGQEVLDNYLGHTASGEAWTESVETLRAQCLQHGVGEVTAYERASH